MSGPQEPRLDLLGYICIATEHRDPAAPPATPICMHDRAWAYCPRDASGTGHVWRRASELTDAELAALLRIRYPRAV